MTTPPLVLVTVGSDHHPFDRLVSWIDSWLETLPPGSVECLVQHGTSSAPAQAQGCDFLSHDELTSLMQHASVIVTQGGPMSIIEARRAGTVPIVVPRESGRGEHVDDHQRVFARHMAAEELAYVPATQQELVEMLDDALEHPDVVVAAHDPEAESRVAWAAHRMEALVDRAVGRSPARRPRVLLIVGAGRSGSTLFERAMGAVPGVVPLGETVHLWERALRDDELCGCGQPFSTCSFWIAVGERAFGGWDAVDPTDVVSLRHSVVRTRYVGGLLGASPRVTWRLRRDRLARLLGALYAAAAEQSASALLVDSSKMPAYAALLTRVDVDLRCVQVVRDPRGVAYSSSKVVPRPEVVDGSSDMPRYGAATSAMWWSVFDVAFRLLRRRGVPVTTVRYEDFVADPRRTVAEVLRFADVPAGEGAFEYLGDNSITLQLDHQIAGNPMRFLGGTITISTDEDWRRNLSVRDRWVVDLLTMGSRRRHGY